MLFKKTFFFLHWCSDVVSVFQELQGCDSVKEATLGFDDLGHCEVLQGNLM